MYVYYTFIVVCVCVFVCVFVCDCVVCGVCVTFFNFTVVLEPDDSFGGLGVACWPLVPKFAGSNPAEAVGTLGQKNPQHAFLRRGSKAVGLMS